MTPTRPDDRSHSWNHPAQHRHRWFGPRRALTLILTIGINACSPAPAVVSQPPDHAAVPATAANTSIEMTPLRVATYNVSLADSRPGGLIGRLEAGDDGARRIAAVIQRLRPDLILLNEFDHDDAGRAADLFQQRYLAVGQFGETAIDYPHRYFDAVNTGVASGFDLDRDGRSDGPGDAWGFGTHPGQYGMLVLSRHPIDRSAVRTFRQFRWHDLPGALQPIDPDTGTPWYSTEAWRDFPLSSKSHWDVPVDTPIGRIHFLVAHPVPPVFDGPEDRNGRRNHDEIRLWAEYIGSPDRPWLIDDAGRPGGLATTSVFVIAGDLNADPNAGDSHPGAIARLLNHPRIAQHAAPERSGQPNQSSNPVNGIRTHTADFGPRTGTLRVDYVLPSQQFKVLDGGVFWPTSGHTGADWITASDHRLVWLDLVPAPSQPEAPQPGSTPRQP